MKNKIIKLVKEGFSVQTLSKMNESQVNALYKRVISEKKEENKEAVTKTQNYKITDYGASEVSSLSSKGQGINVKDGEVSPLPGGGMRVKQNASVDDKKQKLVKDEMGEAKKKKGKNPWAICTATMGKEFGTTERSDWTKSQSKKYEKCVLDVKKSIKEGKDPYETILENTIMDILESSLNPKMTKRDFLNNVYSKSIVEAEEAPVKAPPKPKTPTKPGKPDTPFKPKHKPKPKARIPKWMTWDELGINLK